MVPETSINKHLQNPVKKHVQGLQKYAAKEKRNNWVWWGKLVNLGWEYGWGGWQREQSWHSRQGEEQAKRWAWV